jgi:hypothetical protein
VVIAAQAAEDPEDPEDPEIDAKWKSRKGRLEVKGEGFPGGAAVEIFGNYPSGDVSLGKAYAGEGDEGAWRFKVRLGRDRVPCRVTVVDDSGSIYQDEVDDAPACAPDDRNQPPVAEAGADQVLAAGDRVMLDGSASRDPEGAPLSYRWALVRKPGQSRAALADPNAVATSFVADRRGEYVVELVVSDGERRSEGDKVKVVISSRPRAGEDGDDSKNEKKRARHRKGRRHSSAR